MRCGAEARVRPLQIDTQRAKVYPAFESGASAQADGLGDGIRKRLDYGVGVLVGCRCLRPLRAVRLRRRLRCTLGYWRPLEKVVACIAQRSRGLRFADDTYHGAAFTQFAG